MNPADGTVSFTNTKNGTFTYTPPGPTFTGDVTISYQVTDGTGTSSSTVEIDIGPIAADPVTWGTLSSTTATVPRRPFPACWTASMTSTQAQRTPSPTRSSLPATARSVT